MAAVGRVSKSDPRGQAGVVTLCDAACVVKVGATAAALTVSVAAELVAEPAEVRRRLVENDTLAGLRASLLEDKTLDWVADRAKTV